MAFATFGAHKFAGAGHAKALGSRLVCLEFVFLAHEFVSIHLKGAPLWAVRPFINSIIHDDAEDDKP